MYSHRNMTMISLININIFYILVDTNEITHKLVLEKYNFMRFRNCLQWTGSYILK